MTKQTVATGGDEHSPKCQKVAGGKNRAAVFGRTALLHVCGEWNVEQPGAHTEHRQKETRSDVAARKGVGRADEFAPHGIQQKRKKCETARPQRQNSKFDFSAGPEPCEYAAEADTNNQRSHQR